MFNEIYYIQFPEASIHIICFWLFYNICLAVDFVLTFQIDDNGTIDLPGAIDENVLAITDASSVALDPDLGTVQTWTLGANRTATDSLTTGQSMILMVNDGSSYTITWPTIKWLGASAAGSAPTLATSGYTCIELWKVGSDLYGALIGVSS